MIRSILSTAFFLALSVPAVALDGVPLDDVMADMERHQWSLSRGAKQLLRSEATTSGAKVLQDLKSRQFSTVYAFETALFQEVAPRRGAEREGYAQALPELQTAVENNFCPFAQRMVWNRVAYLFQLADQSQTPLDILARVVKGEHTTHHLMPPIASLLASQTTEDRELVIPLIDFFGHIEETEIFTPGIVPNHREAKALLPIDAIDLVLKAGADADPEKWEPSWKIGSLEDHRVKPNEMTKIGAQVVGSMMERGLDRCIIC